MKRILLILIFLSSHLFLDLFAGEVALFYPYVNTYYGINFNIPLTWTSWQGVGYEGLLVSSLGVGILLFFAIIILPCYYLDNIIEIMEEQHKSFRKASRMVINS